MNKITELKELVKDLGDHKNSIEKLNNVYWNKTQLEDYHALLTIKRQKVSKVLHEVEKTRKDLALLVPEDRVIMLRGYELTHQDRKITDCYNELRSNAIQRMTLDFITKEEIEVYPFLFEQWAVTRLEEIGFFLIDWALENKSLLPFGVASTLEELLKFNKLVRDHVIKFLDNKEEKILILRYEIEKTRKELVLLGGEGRLALLGAFQVVEQHQRMKYYNRELKKLEKKQTGASQ